MQCVFDSKRLKAMINRLTRLNVKKLTPYSSARNEFEGKASVFLDANESPFNNNLNRYPDPFSKALRNAWGELQGVNSSNVIAGNGSDEIIDLLMRAFCEPKQDSIITCPPTYGLYRVLASINGLKVAEVPLINFEPDVDGLFNAVGKLLFICSPNNPTGNAISIDFVMRLCDTFNGIVVVDEAYIDFSNNESSAKLVTRIKNLVVVQTMSKAWGLAGIRMGFGIANEEIIKVLDKIKPPYNVNSLTQQYALKAINQYEQKNEWVKSTLRQRNIVAASLNSIDCVNQVFPSEANFLLVKFQEAKAVFDFLVKRGIVVRNRSTVPGCENCLRITIGTAVENAQLINALKDYKS